MDLQIAKAFLGPLARNPTQTGGRNMANFYVAIIIAILAAALKSSAAGFLVNYSGVIALFAAAYALGSLVAYLICESVRPGSDYQTAKEFRDRPLSMTVGKKLLDDGVVEIFSTVENLSTNPQFTSVVKFNLFKPVNTDTERVVRKSFSRTFPLSRVCGRDTETVGLLQVRSLDGGYEYRPLLRNYCTSNPNLIRDEWGDWELYPKDLMFECCISNNEIQKYCELDVYVTTCEQEIDQKVCLRQNGTITA